MFIDELTLQISAGKGGDGIVSWRHEKGIDHAGPGGGNGGKGGDVYIQGVRDIAHLVEYRFIKEVSAENGQTGLGNCMHGKSGDDLILKLPIGSVVTNTETGESLDILTEDVVFFLKGGMGGYGNDHFKGSRNITPKQSTPGKEGQSGTFFIELKLVVDAGFIGLPNAGKSSLLNTLTKAKAKIGNYQFTTLTPNLGDFYGFILADIPGLIEGASDGKGLGYTFLRHISRTKILLHCISCENPDPLAVYTTIREELGKFDPELLKKTEIIIFTKTDTVSADELLKFKKLFAKTHKIILDVSIINDASVKELSDSLAQMLNNL